MKLRDIYVNRHTKVTGYGYRKVRVIPLISLAFNWKDSDQCEDLRNFHDELAERANIRVDNHQTFFLDDKLCIRFDDYDVNIGLVSDTEISNVGEY